MAGLYWWDDVILSKPRPTAIQQAYRSAINRQLQHANMLMTLAATIHRLRNYPNNPDRLAAIETFRNVYQGGDPREILGLIITQYDVYLETYGPERDELVTKLHCFESMHYELKYVGGRYGYGGFHTSSRRSRGYSFH